MSSIFFTTNPSEWTRVEGVYVSERKPPAAILGIFLGVVCVVGECVRGPVDVAVDVTSPARFAEVFGGRDYGSGGSIIGKIWQSLVGKPFGALKVIRAAAADAVVASTTLQGRLLASAGTITLDTKANHGTADTITIGDGEGTPVVFELDKLGDGVAVGNVQVNLATDTTAAEVAARLKTVIDAQIVAGALKGSTSIVGAVITFTSAQLSTSASISLAKSSSAGACAVVVTVAGTSESKIRVDATSPGVWGNNVFAQILASSDSVDSRFDVVADYIGEQRRFKSFDVSAANVDNTLAVLGDDAGTWIKVTKLANGRPYSTARAALGATVAGTQGTIADTDFTATGRALDVAAGTNGTGVVFVAERSNATIKNKLKLCAAAASDRLYLACSDAANTSDAAVRADAAALKIERLAYCHNWPFMTDPETSALVQSQPCSVLASILSQTDVAINPGDEDAKQYAAGVVKLTKAYVREDLALFRAAGVCVLNDDDGIGFVSGITTTSAEIADRRSIDFLQLSIADALKHFVKKPNTASRRVAMAATVRSFLSGLRSDERVVEDFVILTDSEAGNTPTSRGQNIEKIKIRVRLIGHINFLVLDMEIGTSVSIKVAA